MDICYVYWVHLEGDSIEDRGYVGVTIDLARRWREHTTTTACKHFRNAIDKYVDLLIWDIVLEGSIEECYLLENKLRPLPSIGWNIAVGGQYSGHLHRKLSDTHKQNISNAAKGRIPWNKGKIDVYSDSVLAKMSKAQTGLHMGKDNVMFNKTHTAEAKAKISATHKGKEGMVGADNPSAKKVRCTQTNEEFDTITEAAASIGVTVQALSMHLRGKTKTCGKLLWVFV